MTAVHIPTLNALLNAITAIFLLFGFFFIRRGRIRSHRLAMTSAFVTSTLFLISYLSYHYHAGVKHFAGTGWVRPVYFFILTTHTVLAAVIVPLVLLTLWRAFRGDFIRHRAIARWTWPIWMYVSVTGVVIYWLLYIRFPQTQ